MPKKYIDEQEAKIAWYRELGATSKRAAIAVDLVFERVPTADVQEVRHGYWTCVNTDENVYMCNGDGGCGCTIQLIEGTPEKNMFDYCPECGARMDGKENGDERNT